MFELAMIDINPQNCSTLWMQLHVEKKKIPFKHIVISQRLNEDDFLYRLEV